MPKISALPPNISPDGDDELPGVDGSTASTIKWTLNTIKAWLQSLVGWISTNMLADGAVTGAKIDFAATGAGGVWWEEIGRTTLSSAGTTLSLSSLPVRKYLRIFFVGIPSGSVSVRIRFNNDSGGNYAVRAINNGTSATNVSVSEGQFRATTGASMQLVTAEIVNIATSDKICSFVASGIASSSATAPDISTGVNHWDNSTDAITRIDVYTSTNNLAAGSELVVLGHN